MSKRQNCCEVVGVCGEFGGRKMEEKAQTTWSGGVPVYLVRSAMRRSDAGTAGQGYPHVV